MNLTLVNQWHRRAGFTAALFVIILCVTGILLNHTSTLGLGKKPVPGWIASVIYQLEINPVDGFSLDAGWISQSLNDQLQFNTGAGQIMLPFCTGALKGAVQRGDNIIVACEEELLRLDTSGQLIEQFDKVFGLPVPVSALALHQGDIWVKAGQSLWLLELSTFSLTNSENAPAPLDNIVWATAEPVPNELGLNAVTDITVERLLLDLHSGRILAGWGVAIMDLVAIILIVLTITGYLVWNEKRKLFNE